MNQSMEHARWVSTRMATCVCVFHFNLAGNRSASGKLHPEYNPETAIRACLCEKDDHETLKQIQHLEEHDPWFCGIFGAARSIALSHAIDCVVSLKSPHSPRPNRCPDFTFNVYRLGYPGSAAHPHPLQPKLLGKSNSGSLTPHLGEPVMESQHLFSGQRFPM